MWKAGWTNILSVTVKTDDSEFLRPVGQASNSQRLPVGTRDDIWHASPPNSELWCAVVFILSRVKWNILFTPKKPVAFSLQQSLVAFITTSSILRLQLKTLKAGALHDGWTTFHTSDLSSWLKPCVGSSISCPKQIPNYQPGLLSLYTELEVFLNVFWGNLSKRIIFIISLFSRIIFPVHKVAVSLCTSAGTMSFAFISFVHLAKSPEATL